jgi:hypothetical protein
MKKTGVLLLASALAVGVAVAQDSAKTDMKDAGHDTAAGAKDVGHATETGAKDVGHGTKVAAKDTAHTTKDVGKDIGHGTKKVLSTGDNSNTKKSTAPKPQ